MPRTTPSVRLRLLILLLAPAVVGCFVTGGLLTRHYDEKFSGQRVAYGEATVQQISNHLAEYVVHENTLALTVLVSLLQAQGQIQSLEVYDISDRLLAQAGRDLADGQSFTRDLTYQDSTFGYVRLTILPPPLERGMFVWLALLAGLMLAGVLVWYGSGFIYSWLTGAPATDDSTQDSVQHQPRDATVPPSRHCILVVRIRPSQYLSLYLERFVRASTFYQGNTEKIVGDELMVLFNSPDAVSQAVCTGLLIGKLTERAEGSISFGGAIDTPGDTREKRLRKHASYLASISEGRLLLTEAASRHVDETEVVLQTFHHTLIDSVIYSADQLTDQSLLNLQAEELSASGADPSGIFG